jgi:hypothetical protein
MCAAYSGEERRGEERWGNLKEKSHLEDLDIVDGTIILK